MTSSNAAGGLTRLYSGAGHVFSHVFLTGYAVVVVDLANRGAFGADYATLLPLTGLGLFLYGLGAVPAGLLADRWSGPAMMALFFIGTGLCAIASGLAESASALWLGLAGIGLFSSIYHPVGIAWIARMPGRRGWTIGVNGMLGNLSVALSPLLAGVLIDLASWRAAFIVPGVVCLAFGIAMLLTFKKVREPPHLERQALEEKVAPGARRGLLLLCFTVLCTGVFFSAVTSILPKYAVDTVPTLSSMTSVGLAVAPVFLLGSAGQLLGGHLSDRFPPQIIYLGCWLLQCLALLLVVALGGAGSLLGIAFAVTFLLSSIPSENVMFARFTPLQWRGTMYGVKFVLAFSVGWPIVELSGWVYGKYGGFEILFAVLAAVSLLAAIAAMLIPKENRMTLRQAATDAHSA